MRGGGTSVAGNAIGPGLVIDTSRHLTRIVSIDTEARTATVEPGVVMDTLQRALAPSGLRFGPDPSTSNRATFGGMIGNNACGPHAVAYGRTADNVVSLNVIDGRGDRSRPPGERRRIIPGLDELVQANLALIRTEFGRFSRQVSGYSLEHLLPELRRRPRALPRGHRGNARHRHRGHRAAGSGCHASPHRSLRVSRHARRGRRRCPHARPQASRGGGPWTRGSWSGLRGLAAAASRHLPDGAGWLFVEVGADTEKEARAILAALTRDAGTTSHRVVEDPREAARLWSIRADGAGLAGRSEDNHECWPGWEDAAVPPENLGAYLREFDALMARHGVTGQPFGHFGDGCIHVRLDIPLTHRRQRRCAPSPRTRPRSSPRTAAR